MAPVKPASSRQRYDHVVSVTSYGAVVDIAVLSSTAGFHEWPASALMSSSWPEGPNRRAAACVESSPPIQVT